MNSEQERRSYYSHPSWGGQYSPEQYERSRRKFWKSRSIEYGQDYYQRESIPTTSNPKDVSRSFADHDLAAIKDMVRAIMNTLDEQKLILESHSDVLDELSELLLSDDD